MATRQLRAQKKRQAILEAALSIAGAEGTSAVTHRAVAERAGIAVGAITYYFSSTSRLLEETLRLAHERERERLAAVEPADPGDADAWARGLADHLFIASEADRERKLAVFEMHLATARQARFRAEYADWQQEYLRITETALAAGGSKDPVHDARMLNAALLGVDLVQLALGGLPRELLEATIAAFINRLVDA